MGTSQRARLAICSLATYWLAFAGIVLLVPSPWLAIPTTVAITSFIVTLWALSALPSEAPLGFDYGASPRGWRALAEVAGWPSTVVVTALGLCLVGSLAGIAVGFVRFLSA